MEQIKLKTPDRDLDQDTDENQELHWSREKKVKIHLAIDMVLIIFFVGAGSDSSICFYHHVYILLYQSHFSIWLSQILFITEKSSRDGWRWIPETVSAPQKHRMIKTITVANWF